MFLYRFGVACSMLLRRLKSTILVPKIVHFDVPSLKFGTLLPLGGDMDRHLAPKSHLGVQMLEPMGLWGGSLALVGVPRFAN